MEFLSTQNSMVAYLIDSVGLATVEFCFEKLSIKANLADPWDRPVWSVCLHKSPWWLIPWIPWDWTP
jgi:hypothetical protein